MTSPARRAEPDPPSPPPHVTIEGDGHTYIGAMTYAEYRRMDEASDARLEYVGGVVYATSGGTTAHDVIVGNVLTRLHGPARKAGCRTYSQGVKLRTPRGDEYVPDVTLVCGPRASNTAHYVEGACLVVEVLSQSTARTDMGEKRLAYQEMESLGAYLLVETEWRRVHRHWRDADGRWQTEEFVGDGTVPLSCPTGGVLTLAEIYEDLDLSAAPPPPPVPRLRRVREGAAV